MTNFNGDTKLEQLVQRMNPTAVLLRAWPMTGGLSAQVTALEIRQADGQVIRRIVRRHGEADLKRNPQVAATEFRLLNGLKSSGLAVPTPYYLDESREIYSAPCIVIEYMEGQPDFAPADISHYLLPFAEHLAKLHRTDCPEPPVWLPPQEEAVARTLIMRAAGPDESLNVSAISDALKSAGSLTSGNKDAILHGDYWPGNILWKDGELAAIIDWEDAAWGDPLADFANARLEMLFHFGVDAMHGFTQHYKSLMADLNFSTLPYWDLYASLRLSTFPQWGLAPAAEKSMRDRHGWFAARAMNEAGKR